MASDWMARALGASNHTTEDRAEYDYYSTDPHAAELLLDLEPFLCNSIWECACGENALADVFARAGKRVRCSDIVVRRDGVEQLDFLSCHKPMAMTDIVTNPPYKYAREFVERALELVEPGRYVCMFLKLSFLEGKGRRALFDSQPPIRVWVSSSRLTCYKDGVVQNYSSPAAYAWFVWKKGWRGPTTLGWFN